MLSVLPAPAGINRNKTLEAGTDICVPRASGDKPLIELAQELHEECSPRQRG